MTNNNSPFPPRGFPDKAGSYRKVLLVSWNRMGDLLQLTPILNAFHHLHPTTEVHLSVARKFVDVANGIHHVAKILPFDFGEVLDQSRKPEALVTLHQSLRSQIAALQTEQYDLVVNLTHNRLTALFCHLLNAPETRGLIFDEFGYRAVREPWSRYFFLANLNRGQNRINLVDIQSGIAGFHPGEPLSFHVSDDVQSQVDEQIHRQGFASRTLVAIQTGASQPNKEWTPASFTEIAKRLVQNGITPVWVGAENELPRIEPLAKSVSGSWNAAGKTSVAELAALLKRCRLLLTNDTGTMHVAVCMATPVISLNLGTPLSHETGPYQAGSRVMEATIPCYPCSFHVECLHYRCHEVLDVESVWTEVAAALQLPPGKGIANDVRVWTTGFDENGFWELIRDVPEYATPEELVAVVWAEVWKRELAHRPAVSTISDSVDLRLQREYIPSSIPEAVAKLSSRFAALQHILNLLYDGIRDANLLCQCSSQRDFQQIVQLGEALEQIDSEIHRIGIVHTVWRPLLSMFVSGKDALTGTQIEEIAPQTLQLYHDILRIGEQLFSELQRIENSYGNRRKTTVITAAGVS
ncbi:MAG: glycosyltransferase family 9 protein [bacterium]|nr:glycosyltransferase family 9 protein [bacterium]